MSVLGRAWMSIYRTVPEGRIPNALMESITFRQVHGPWPRIRHPQTFSEHLLAMKVSGEPRSPERAFVTDKELVKVYVRGVLGKDVTIPTLHVIRSYSDATDLNLPWEVVLKATPPVRPVAFSPSGPPSQARR